MIEKVLEDISNGFDGLIKKVEFKNLQEVIVLVLVKSKCHSDWAHVEFTMDNLVEYKIAQPLNSSNEVMSMGISFHKIDGVNYIDFSPYSEIMMSPDDYRKSNFYFASKNIKGRFFPLDAV